MVQSSCQLEGEPEDPAFWDMGEPSAKIVAGANANAVLSLDLIAEWRERAIRETTALPRARCPARVRRLPLRFLQRA